MSSEEHYQEYVRDYQTRSAFEDQFFEEIRDRHKVMLEYIRRVYLPDGDQRLLDFCCANGTFLGHVKPAFPSLRLTGLDLGEELIIAARNNERLSGVQFHCADVLEMQFEEPFDIITGNNALSFFDQAQYETAVGRVWRSLRPGGFLFLSDLYHPFDHELMIVERNSWYPGELVSFHRSFGYVRRVFETLGARDISFRPFVMSKDLPCADNSSRVSHTVRTADGGRLDMRGGLLQPFCHFSAQKPT